jgi:signal transduction histidine kinase/tetratricopeptide (TPR) repeat protein
MKLFTNRIFTQRRIILIFLLAIFLPSLIAAYLSLSTLSKRRESVKNLLESNLWISSEAALRSVEGALIENEQKILRPENFSRLASHENAEMADSLFPGDSAGKTFLLDADFKIVYPEAVNEDCPEFRFGKNTGNNKFRRLLSMAEDLEFSLKDYDQAAELFKESTMYAPTDQYRAIAFEGFGRCLIASARYDEARKVYKDLMKNYGQVRNKAGHPYGIIGAFQMSFIAEKIREERYSLEILLSLYQKIKNGTWTISRPVYDFYVSEIDLKMGNESTVSQFPEIRKVYADLQKHQSPYRETLLFMDFLEKNIIPGIKDKLSLNLNNKGKPDRFQVASENEFSLISYTAMPKLLPGQGYYAGFLWDTGFLRDNVIPGILDDFSKDSGLDFKLVSENNRDFNLKAKDQASNESVALTFRIFPLPWILLASYPEIEAIERSARREIFFYGVLLAVIIILMLLGAVLIARDISRESETNRLKTEFVNNISHELKTPLTLIRLYGETLQRKKDLTNIEKRECYEIITKESERLSHLINNVLDFSRIDMGRKEFDLKKVYIQDVINDTLESYKYHLEKKGFIVKCDIAADLPEMRLDREAISSVLVNLLSNAMKFSPVEKKVEVRLFRGDANAVLQVADKGIGIPLEEIPKIFRRFYRTGNKIVTETMGSGLGLTLVKHIVEAHGGTIEVESDVGQGSRFTVRLPMGES